MEKLFSFFKSSLNKKNNNLSSLQSNISENNSNPCEAGPSKRFKEDDSSTFLKVHKESILNDSRTIDHRAPISNETKMHSNMKECFNNTTTYHGSSMYNKWWENIGTYLKILEL